MTKFWVCPEICPSHQPRFNNSHILEKQLSLWLKGIKLPTAEGIDYQQLVTDTTGFSDYLERQIAEHSELFPARIGEGDRNVISFMLSRVRNL
ncbi:hypothetical protein [Leptolyngbya sp. NM3-A1]|uniref:hypothetical protein n=1 Tax=unclassified Leptolyngbya TaxID=2650499 RepID=UPI0032985742